MAANSFAYYVTATSGYYLQDKLPPWLAETWPYSYQHLGVGYPPANIHFGYMAGSTAIGIFVTVAVRLAIRHLLLIP